MNLRFLAILVNLSGQIFGGKKLLNLESPVVSESGGADDQVADPAVLALVPWSEQTLPLSRLIKNQAQSLYGLSQTHVVTEREVKVVARKCGHPRYALQLVPSQFAVDFDVVEFVLFVHGALNEGVQEFVALSSLVFKF